MTQRPGPDGWLEIPHAPSIAGLRFRGYRDEDLDDMVELFNAAISADGGNETWTPAALRNEIENLTHIDPHLDYLMAFVEDRLVATSEIEWSDTPDGQRHYRSRGYVHPDWRRRGIGVAMLSRNEQRLAEIAAGHAHQGPAALTSLLSDLDKGGVALLDSHGYQRVRVYHHMVRPDLDDIVVTPLPDGLVVRPLKPDQLGLLWDGMLEAFRDHFGGHDASPEAFRRWAGDPNFELGLAVIAFDGDAIAGGVHGYIDPDENRIHGYLRGWADPVFTRRRWRRRGLAAALLGRTLVLLRDRGMTSAQLEVDSENPNQALGLYERHRFSVDHSDSEWHRPLNV